MIDHWERFLNRSKEDQRRSLNYSKLVQLNVKKAKGLKDISGHRQIEDVCLSEDDDILGDVLL